MRKIIKYFLLGAAGLIVCLIVLVFIAVSWQPEVESRSHISHVDWLPSASSDITYARRGGFGEFLAYECTLPEEEFRSLAQKEGWPIRDATNVQAPSGLRMILNLPDPTNAEGTPIYHIERAYHFEERFPNNGGTLVIYDRQRARLFFHKSHR